MYYIYYIKNITDDKFYIGLTNNFKRREKRHFSDLRNKRHDNIHLQNSFNKYKEESFEFKVIYEADCTQDEISEMEKHFIKKYDSFKNGFNMNLGGFDNNGFVSKFSKEDVFNILSITNNILFSGEVLADIFNTSRTSIGRIKKGESFLDYRKEFENLSKDERDNIFYKFENKFQVSKKINKRMLSKNKKFDEYVYLCILAYNEKHKRKSSMMAGTLKCDPSTIRLIIRGKTNILVYKKFLSLRDEEKEEYYNNAKKLFENNASLCGNT